MMIDFKRFWLYNINIKRKQAKTLKAKLQAEVRQAMLPEERLEAIVRIVNERKSVSNQELTSLLDASESTIRRDITTLAARGRLVKVHGGAMAENEERRDFRVEDRRAKNAEAKKCIAQYAAKLIHDGDMVYIDAGTTTEYLAEYITAKDAVYVTNGVVHAKKLSERGFEVHVVGGMLKPVTEALIGAEAVLSLQRFNFTLGFFGANGVSATNGITTPDISEAAIKSQAFECCNKCYVLCDATKFDKVCAVKFAETDEAVIITEKEIRGYENCNLEVAQ